MKKKIPPIPPTCPPDRLPALQQCYDALVLNENRLQFMRDDLEEAEAGQRRALAYYEGLIEEVNGQGVLEL